MSLNEMTAPEVATWVQTAARVLLSKDLALASATLDALNEDVELALATQKRADIIRTINEVAARHLVSPAALRGKMNRDTLHDARAHAAYELRHRLGMTYTEIGRALRRHHAQALRWVAAWEKKQGSIR